jgi:hypothetical protein
VTCLFAHGYDRVGIQITENNLVSQSGIALVFEVEEE